MRINHLVNKSKYISGYSSAIELIGVLAVFAFVILFSNQFLKEELRNRRTNQLVDQGKSFSAQAIRYIEDDYRVLLQQLINQSEIVIPYSRLIAYSSKGVTNQINNLQTTCLYVTSGGANILRAYIIWGATSAKVRKLDKKTIGEIVHGLGGNAGDLINNNGIYVISGYTENELSLSQSTINNITQGCGFISPMPSDSLIINLTKNINLFAPISGRVDSQSTFNDSDPTLKKNSRGNNKLNTMQTNVYLDNVVKESDIHTVSYCDPRHLPVSDAEAICSNYASIQGIHMYAKTASWVSSIMDNTTQSCVATASAHFYNITPVLTCNGVNLDITSMPIDDSSATPIYVGTMKPVQDLITTWCLLCGQVLESAITSTQLHDLGFKNC